MSEFTDAFAQFTLADEKVINEKRAALHKRQVEVNNLLNTAPTAELADEWERIDAEMTELTNKRTRGLQIRSFQNADSEIVAEREERTGNPAEVYNKTFAKYLRGGILELDLEERQILMQGADKRVQQTLTGASGGYLVPDGFWNRLVEAQAAFGSIEAYANVISTATGNDLPWLTMNDTANTGELLNEGDTVSAQDMAFDAKVLRAFTYSSKLILVSWQLMQDSAFDLEGLIARVAARRLATIHTTHLTTGDGVNKPQGITVGLTGGKSFAGAAAITYDELIDIQHILDPAYRNGNQRFMFSDATLKLIRKLVDGQGNKAWQPSMTAGAPDRILGDPYVVNQAMPAPTTGNVSVLYGDFSQGYVVRRVKGATAVRLNEKYAETLQTGFFVYDRLDGRPDVTSAYTYGIQA